MEHAPEIREKLGSSIPQRPSESSELPKNCVRVTFRAIAPSVLSIERVLKVCFCA